ncbi:fumarate hydratase C-terminal domain-containing protein [Ramlibacter sp. AW1]|uniref:Fumarate hydratase C-terminal domain-containing protein n=1 Tax=Ramlibacter aurantiacus TaxID=2801330 RepID=A0A937D0X6_9BURK|nr:fumarate hydratase C-terminal domain-containing protein [Ramlibacter aurantiacus]MBL0419929.1 fumarate hydratase C-terminal domain-containing protein [Ramlibacter aurantiacus]
MKQLHLPLSRADVEALELGELVLLSGQATMSIGLPTHQRMVDHLDSGTALPVDLRDGAFFHLSCFNRERPDGSAEALYLNPTTSTRYDAYMPRLIEGCGLRLVGGKGGLGDASVQAMQRQGCAYLSFLGGGCTLLSQAIRRVVSVHWTEAIAQFRLLTLELSGLGPATVAIDAHGRSLYQQLQAQASQRLQASRIRPARE